MFRRFFKIGFGGCGCKLEEHFRKHAVNLTYNMLKTHYLKDLKGWKNGLPLDHKFGIAHTVDRLDSMLNKELTDTTFNEKLDEIAAELRSWQVFSEIVEKTGKPYEDVILEDIRDIVKTMEKEVDETKNKGKILFESLPVDSFTETEVKGKSERFYVYNQNITETRELIVDQFGQVVIESQGFNHQPELQMLPFSIKEVRDEVFKKITSTIETRRLKDSATGGYLFFVGLGGGTGTGVISPLAEKFGKGSLGYFTVAVLGGKDDDKVLQSQKPWFRRCFNMLIALNDLIVTAELDGIILVDNDVIMKEIQKKGKSGPALMAEIDEKIIEKLYPAFGITVLDGNDLDWSQLKGHIGLHTLKKKPPVIVPCYASGDCSTSEGNLEHLIDEALKDKDKNNGKLAPCKRLEGAERVFVYVRCIKDEEKLRKKLADKFVKNNNKIAILKDYLFCWDDVVETEDYTELKRFLKDKDLCNISWADEAVLGKTDKDKLVFCKNGSDKCVTVQIGRHLFDWMDSKGLKRYFEEKKIPWADPLFSDNKIIIGEGETKAEITLDEKNEKATLSWGKEGKEKHVLDVKKEGDKRKIYEPNEVEITIEGKKLEEALFKVKKWNDKRHIYLKKCQATRTWIKNNLEKDIVVFESQEIGSFWHEREKKKNEVLILLFNPDVEEALSDRLLEAKKFVDLLVRFKKVIDDKAKEGSEDKLDIAGQIIEQINKGQIVNADLNEKLKAVEDTLKEDIKEEDKPLPQAKIFLFPEELYDKDKGIYVRMGEILDRLKSEVGWIPEEGKDGDWWPIFRENIFNIISTSGKRDEVILSAIEALEDQNKFNRLVGEKVYNTYFETFKREYFKYNARYLYPGVGEPILSDDAEKELPVALKEEIDKKETRIEGEDIKDLVKEYTIKPVHLFSFEGVLTEDNIKKGFKDEGEKEKISLSDRPIFIKGEYWFTWEKVKGADEYNFRERLTNDCNFEWAKNAEIVMDKTARDKIVLSNKEESKNLELTIPDSGNALTINSQELKIENDGSNQYIYKEKDDEVTIIDGAKIYSARKNEGKIDVYSPSKLSYPAMLAVAGLYAEWEQVGSLPYDENINRYNVEEEEKEAIFQKLFGKLLRPGDFEIYELPKESVEEIDIPDNPKILIIDADEEDATLVIREADKDLLRSLTKEDVPESSNKEIPQRLVDRFKEKGIEHVNNVNYNVTERKLQPEPKAIKDEKLYRCYYIKEYAGKYSIDGDKIHDKLKVKKEKGEDGKTLKIYKKRGDKFKAAEVDGEAKIE